MSDNVEHIFVYGTLRRGFWNNRLLYDAVFVGPAQTCGSYALYVDGLPYVVREPAVGPIMGEVYALPAWSLPRIDALEGHPDLYARERIAYALEGGEKGEAWLYFYPRPEGVLVPSGDYAVWSTEQTTDTATQETGTVCYFAYGADMLETQMRARCHHATPLGAACLADFSLLVTRHGLLDARPKPGEEVYGVVWQLTGEEAGLLERFQRADLGACVRVEREVALLRGDVCRATVYAAAQETLGQHVKPAYREKVLEGARAAGLPSFYVGQLASLP